MAQPETVGLRTTEDEGEELGPIHTKDSRFFCCGNSAADISKPHTFKWHPLADDVLEAA